jgi:hypothetical protein
MDASSRRWVAGFIRFGLVILAIAVVASWFTRRGPTTKKHRMSVQTDVPAPDSLREGDLRIFNADSSVDVILSGDRILAGLSPKTVGKIRSELDTAAATDSGLGGSIASLVKKTVAGAIETHMVYRVSDIRDVRYEDGRLVLEWMDGTDHNLFGDTKVNGRRQGNTFRAEDAERFIDAFHERKKSLGPM